MGNSIEEDIKNAEHFIKSIKIDKEYKEENGWHGYYNKEIVELARILQHILSDYKRVLKENERLQKENEMFSFSERVIKEVVKRDDEYTKQVIRDYFTKRYPKENLKFDFLDEEIVNEIIKLGIAEYKKRQALGGVLSERKY